MNNELDKWLAKNVTHSTDQAPTERGFVKPKKQKKSKKPLLNKKSGHTPKGNNKPQNQNKKKNKPRRHDRPQSQTKPKLQSSVKPVGDKVLRMIPLGGLNEVGKNMMAIEYGDDIIVIDMGLQFPEDDMLGVDYIVPDTTYLEENAEKIRGILITHGHLDHIGGIPAIAPKLKHPNFYGTKLTMGLVDKQVSEFALKDQVKMITIKPGEKFRLGVFQILFFRVNHSIPDSTGIAIETPEGIIVHTGDFKFDLTPADGIMADMHILKKLGKNNVLAMFSDSTNATKPGTTMSEKVVGENLAKIINETDGRLIIASFSSLIGRMQQIIDAAKVNNRQIYISGRSMIHNVAIATKMGYLKYPKGMVKELRRAKKNAENKNALILTTGSQGEPLAGLTRMAINSHKDVKINDKDTVVFSSSPIVGNERAITSVVNELARRGARVINNKVMDIHTTGHGHQEDLKLMLSTVRPKYLIPVHGEFYMRKAHKELAEGMGMQTENIILADNGSVIESKNGKLQLSKESLNQGLIMIDNQSNKLSNVASHIISDRQFMAQNGVIIPTLTLNKKTKQLMDITIESHGFIYMRQTAKILKEIEAEVREAYKRYEKNHPGKLNRNDLKTYMKGQIQKLIANKIERYPLVSPIIVDI